MAKRVKHRGRVTTATTERGVVHRSPLFDVEGSARAAVQRQRARVWSGRLQQAIDMDPSVGEAYQRLGQLLAPDDHAHPDHDPDGECSHLAGSPVDMTPPGPSKVWRCDQCDWLYRLEPVGDGTTIMVAVA